MPIPLAMPATLWIREDEGKPIRKSHENPDIQQLYKVYLGEPLGELSEKLLHTRYFDKSIK